MKRIFGIGAILIVLMIGGVFLVQVLMSGWRSTEAPNAGSATAPGKLEGSHREPDRGFTEKSPENKSESRASLLRGEGSGAILSLDEIPVVTMDPIDLAETRGKAEILDKKRGNGVFRFAEPIDVEITPDNSGVWETLPDGRVMWRTRVASPGAESLNLGFLDFQMPEGGRLSVFPAGREDDRPIRDFTAADNEEHGQLWTPIFRSDELAIEVVLPADQRQLLALTLSKVNHGFRGLKNTKIGGETSGACNVDVACTADPTVGALVSMFANQIRSVGAYTLGGTDTCSGALINNTNNNGTPYFLTAEHCGIDPANAPSMVVYFNFENSTCRTPESAGSGGVGDGDLSQFNSGAIHRAENADSDFCLVELDDPIPPAYNVFFSGWDRTGANGSATGIHHPAVAEKRISFDLDNTVDDGSTHVRVLDWDHGTTEGGSSGSPLFDFNGRIIGDLTGGGAACGNDLSDSYGRVSVSWTGGGTTATRLSDWLDPAATGANTLDGVNQDDALSIDDVQITEGHSGTQILNFTVSLARISNDTVTVQYQTFNDTANAGSDFVGTNGTLTFVPGDSMETIPVTINGDISPEEHETFEVRLSNPTNGVIGDSVGVGTINNDDFIPPVITSSLTANGNDSVPFSYQITANNTPTGYAISIEPAGMTVNSATGEISWTPTSVGQFTVTITATNPAGSDNETLTIDVGESPLREGLDSLRTFTEGADKWTLETATTHDGVDAAKSPLITHSQTAFFETQVTAPAGGDGATFWWKVSSESEFDFLRFLADGVLVQEISGEIDWVQVSHPLAGGSTTTLRWEYVKDDSVSEGSDAGFIDELELSSDDPLPTFTSASNAAGEVGQPFSFDVDAFSATSYSEANLPAGLGINTGTGLITGTPIAIGSTVATITATNGNGSRDQLLTIDIVPSLPSSVDADLPQITWSTSGDADWFAQLTTTNDGVDAAQSGDIDDSQSSTLQADVNFDGAQALSFWWKVSSESDFDFLRFNIGGVEDDSISGEIDWAQKTGISIPAGPVTLTWIYDKDGSVSAGSDTGWLDEVVFSYKLGAPANFTASDGTAFNAVRLAWEAAAGSTEYRVFRNTTNDLASATPIATVPGGLLTYDDAGATPGIQYHYWVRAFNATDMLGATNSTATGFVSPGLSELIINEIEADNEGADDREFIEIFDGGAGNTDLTNAVVVFYNGATDQSYHAISLNGHSTDVNGYFVIGNTSVPGVGVIFADGLLQDGDVNGSDAVALFVGTAGSFPTGSAVTTLDLIDAVVYKTTGQPDDPGLAALLNGGEPQLDDDASGNEGGHSLQRFPNGAGGVRNTSSFVAIAPTPGADNTVGGAPSIPDLTTVSDSGSSQSDDITNVNLPTFTGTARPGALVTVTASAVDLGTAPADSNGDWTFTAGAALADGPHSMSATADKHAGGGVSGALLITVDTQPPPVPASLDLDAVSDAGVSASDDITNLNTPQINGDEAESGVTVTLNSDVDGDVGSVVVSSPWSIVTSVLSEGLHQLAARAEDVAGNISVDSTALAIQIDLTRPGVTIDQAVGQPDPATAGPINFTAVFSETVHEFLGGDVSIGGTAGAGLAVLSGGPANFGVAVSGATQEGTVTAAIGVSVVIDTAGNPNFASTSGDNKVDLDLFGGFPGPATVLIFSGNTATTPGALFAGDMDFFEFTLANPSEITLATTGSTGTRGSLYDNSNNLLNDPDADAAAGTNFSTTDILPAGTYRVDVEGKTGIESGVYDFEIAIDREVNLQPDLMIGKSPAALLGPDFYTGTGVGQLQVVVSKRLKKARFFGQVGNDGDAPDDLTMGATRGNKKFKVIYLDGAGNVTGAMVAGIHLKSLPPGASEATQILVKPSRKLKNRKTGKIKRKKFTATVSATSRLDPGMRDVVQGLTKTK